MARTKKTPEKKNPIGDREKAENIEEIIIDLGKQGVHPAKIGLILKEKHNVDAIKPLGKKITQILKGNNIKYDTDLDFVNKKIGKIQKHSEKNKQDKRAKREIVRFIGLKKKIEEYQNRKISAQ